MKLFLYSLCLLAANTPALAKRSSSGASAKPAATAGECLQTALNGRIEGDCAEDPEADACVGMKLAIRNSLRQDQCRARAGQGCLVYSYRQNTQAQWLSVAAGYLAEALQCVRAQYGSEDSSGFQEALADPSFKLKLGRLDDGAAAFGLREGEILTRALQGEELRSVLQSSPAWAAINPREKDRMLAAAEAPVNANIESHAIPSAKLEALAAAGFPANAKQYEKLFRGPDKLSVPSRAPARIDTSAPSSADSSAPPRLNTSAPSRIYVRVLKHNPFSLGLDLTLFERVSSIYQKRGEGLQGVDDYLKRLPKRQGPRDVRDLISRGKVGEL